MWSFRKKNPSTFQYFQDLHVSCLVNEKFYLIKSQLLQHISLSYTHRICIALVTHFIFISTIVRHVPRSLLAQPENIIELFCSARLHIRWNNVCLGYENVTKNGKYSWNKNGDNSDNTISWRIYIYIYIMLSQLAVRKLTLQTLLIINFSININVLTPNNIFSRQMI